MVLAELLEADPPGRVGCFSLTDGAGPFASATICGYASTIVLGESCCYIKCTNGWWVRCLGLVEARVLCVPRVWVDPQYRSRHNTPSLFLSWGWVWCSSCLHLINLLSKQCNLFYQKLVLLLQLDIRCFQLISTVENTAHFLLNLCQCEHILQMFFRGQNLAIFPVKFLLAAAAVVHFPICFHARILQFRFVICRGLLICSL